MAESVFVPVPAAHPGTGPPEHRMLIAGRRVEGIGLGTAQFAFRDGTTAEAVATVRAALDAGVTLIDTALAYTRPGIESYAEQVIARALREVIRDRFPVDGRPEVLRAHCETSLRTLGVDRIDLYQLHHVDAQVPLPDSVGALEGLRQEGKIAAIGLSNVTATQLDQALAITPVAAVQNQLSYGRPDDLPTALACGERGIAYLAYMAFAGVPGTPHGAALAVARRHGVSVHRVLLAWLRTQSPHLIPLVGASRPASIRDSAALLELTDRDLMDMRAAQSAATSA